MKRLIASQAAVSQVTAAAAVESPRLSAFDELKRVAIIAGSRYDWATIAFEPRLYYDVMY